MSRPARRRARRRALRRPARGESRRRAAGRYATGRSPSCARSCPDVPTLDEALAFFVDEAPRDRRPPRPQADGARARRSSRARAASGSSRRSFVSSFYVGRARVGSRRSTRRRAHRRHDPARRARDLRGAAADAPLARVGLRALRVRRRRFSSVRSSARADASAARRSTTRSSPPRRVRAAHARGAAVVTWTVDDPARSRAGRRGRRRRGRDERSDAILRLTSTLEA